MTTADQLNAIHLDWANGKVSLSQALWDAYALGFNDCGAYGHEYGSNPNG